MRALLLLPCILAAGCLIDRDLYEERYTELGGVDTAEGPWGVRFADTPNCIAVDAAEIDLGGTFTFDVYLRAEAAPGSGILPVVAWNGAFAIYQDTEGRLVAGPSEPPPAKTAVVSPVSLFDGAYHHLALTYGQSGYATLYLDGTRLMLGPVALGSAPVTTLHLGCWPEQDVAFRGDIGEARLSDVAFYGSDFEPEWRPYDVESTTLVLWHLDEGEGRKVYDATGIARGTIEVEAWVPFPLGGEPPR